MKTTGWTAFGAGFFFAARLAAVADGAPLAGKLHAPEKGELASLERLVPRLMKDGDVPGLSLAVVQNGQVVYRRAFGVRDESTGAPVDDDTIFEAASLSKPVFAHAVLKLADAGQLDLDAPLAMYLPGDYVEDPRLRAITARRVLSHTTGFPNWRPDGQPLKIHFDPGERFSYSGEGFVYLQKAVENRTGQTLEALMRRLVFEPLRMTSSSYTWQDRFEGRKAIGHDNVGSPLGLRRPTVSNAAASLHTTGLDYARFLAAVLDGTGLRKETAAQMIHPQIHVDEGCQNCINTKPTGRLSREIGWGLGWGVQETEDGPSLWHWGDNGSGSAPSSSPTASAGTASSPRSSRRLWAGATRHLCGSATSAGTRRQGRGSKTSSRADRLPSLATRSANPANPARPSPRNGSTASATGSWQRRR